MALTAAASSLATRRGIWAVALVLTIATAVGIAVFRPGFLPNGSGSVGNAISNQVGKGVANVQALGNTVADILAGRSPGERAAGALASLKHKRLPVLHQRALPKIRRPASPLAGIVAAPAVPPIAIPPSQTPLYNVVNGTPTPVPVVATAPLPGGGPPVVFPGITPPPGGGGGIIIPPIVEVPPVTPPVIPPVIPPTIPGVPEPASWAMMLLGFALIGQAIRRDRRHPRAIAAH